MALQQLPLELDEETVAAGMTLPTDRPEGILRDCKVRGVRELSRDVHSLTGLH